MDGVGRGLPPFHPRLRGGPRPQQVGHAPRGPPELAGPGPGLHLQPPRPVDRRARDHRRRPDRGVQGTAEHLPTAVPRSLADFWNRYYFYFKELLVDFFFSRRSCDSSRAGRGSASSSRPSRLLGSGTSCTTISVAWRSSPPRDSSVRWSPCRPMRSTPCSSRSGSAFADPEEAGHAGRGPGEVVDARRILGFYCLLGIPGAAPPGTTLAECWQFVIVPNPLR